MQSSRETATSNRKALWAGRIISALPALFLFVDVPYQLYVLTTPVFLLSRQMCALEEIIAGASSTRTRNEHPTASCDCSSRG